jgi:hypothetical protein
MMVYFVTTGVKQALNKKCQRNRVFLLAEAASLQDNNPEIDSQTFKTETETENGSITAAAKAFK